MEATKQNHPSPWPWSAGLAEGDADIMAADGSPVAQLAVRGDLRANEEFIIRACNSHALLLGALRALVEEDFSPDNLRRARTAIAVASKVSPASADDEWRRAWETVYAKAKGRCPRCAEVQR